jgi:homocysteine S-methyltransferase
MTTSLNYLLAQSPDVILMDGGMGTMVQDRGIDVGTCLWGSHALVTEQGRLRNVQIHRDFIAAGAQILIANTHNADSNTCERFLREYDLSQVQLPDHLRHLSPTEGGKALYSYITGEAIKSVQKAISSDQPGLVATCIGSVEGAYATESHLAVDAVCDYMEAQIPVHVSAGTQLMLFEALTTRQEIAGIAKAIQNQGLHDFGVGLTCGADGCTLAGVSMAEAVDLLSMANPIVYFIQCTDYELVAPVLKALIAALGSEAITGVYANDGRVWDPPVWRGSRVSPAAYAQAALTWYQAGARIIGGCCGTTPAHITALRDQFLNK